MNKLTFGTGKISVAHAEIDGKECLLLEPSRGEGTIGARIKDRKKGMTVEVDKDATVLEFNYIESLDIVIETLMEIRKSIKVNK